MEFSLLLPDMLLWSTTLMRRVSKASHRRCIQMAVSSPQCKSWLWCLQRYIADAHSCHGGAIFPGIIDPATGKSIISGKKVTGFTTKGEEEEGVLDTIKSWNRPTIEAAAADAGAICMSIICLISNSVTNEYSIDVSPPGPWDAFTQTDGLIVTGM